jgi:hypothetical protein
MDAIDPILQRMNSRQQLELYQLLKTRGYLRLEEVIAIYKSKQPADEFLNRMLLLGVMKVSPEPGLFLYLPPSEKEIQISKISRFQYVECLRSLQLQFENTIPELNVIQAVSERGVSPKEAIEIRQALILEDKIRLNDRGAIVILSDDIRLKDQPEEEEKQEKNKEGDLDEDGVGADECGSSVGDP